jgi:hypothetical protein
MLHLPQQKGKPRRHTDDMQQAKPRERIAGLGLLFVLGLLGTAAVLGVTLKTAARRAVGLMPEIVCTADRSLMIVDEIVVRAPRPGHLVDAVVRLSGINK